MTNKLLLTVFVAFIVSVGIFVRSYFSTPNKTEMTAMEKCVHQKVELLPSHEKLAGAIVFDQLCQESLRKN